MVRDQQTPGPPTPRLRGWQLALRLVASVVLTPVGLLLAFTNVEISGSPGSTEEARAVAWWLEPFRQLKPGIRH